MQGHTEKAMARLRSSPPGLIRTRTTKLPLDPRFESLWDLPEFSDLFASHLAEIDRQRAAYLAKSESFAVAKTGVTVR